MPTSRRGLTKVAVKIDRDVWREEVERLDDRSRARVAAERERRELEEAGVALAQLQRCDELGDDRTRLPGLVKVYVPIIEAAASMRPYGMVFSPEPGPLLTFIPSGTVIPQRGPAASTSGPTSASTGATPTSREHGGRRAPPADA